MPQIIVLRKQIINIDYWSFWNVSKINYLNLIFYFFLYFKLWNEVVALCFGRFWTKHLGPNAPERENIKLDGLVPEVLVWTRPDQKLFGPDAYGPSTRLGRNNYNKEIRQVTWHYCWFILLCKLLIILLFFDLEVFLMVYI